MYDPKKLYSVGYISLPVSRQGETSRSGWDWGWDQDCGQWQHRTRAQGRAAICSLHNRLRPALPARVAKFTPMTRPPLPLPEHRCAQAAPVQQSCGAAWGSLIQSQSIGAALHCYKPEKKKLLAGRIWPMGSILLTPELLNSLLG